MKTQLEDLADLGPNQIYPRGALHDAFGGQRQGGISTPRRFAIVMLFSGDEGAQYGYGDEWSEDGRIFRCTGGRQQRQCAQRLVVAVKKTDQLGFLGAFGGGEDEEDSEALKPWFDEVDVSAKVRPKKPKPGRRITL
jgi:hypothetical protein